MKTPPSTMRAVVLQGPGGPEALEVRHLPVPQAGPGQVLIRVEAFGINRSEQHFRKGMADFGSFPRIPGLEAVGTVVDAPDGGFAPGQQVAALMGGMGRLFDGGYAEYTCVPTDIVLPFTSPLPWETIGAVPEMLQTAHGSLTIGTGSRPGDVVLVRGATSSVGLMCLSLAASRGISTVATTRRSDHVELLRLAGATHIVLDNGQVAPAVLDLTHGRGVDGAVELVGTSVLRDTLACVRPGGTACFTGMLSDTWTITDFQPMAWLRNGVRLTAYSGEASDLPAQVLQGYLDALSEGRVAPVHTRVLHGLDNARTAHEAMDAGEPGKKVVRVLHEDEGGAETGRRDHVDLDRNGARA